MSADLDYYAEASHQLTLPDAAILAIRVFALYLAYFFASTLIQSVLTVYFAVQAGGMNVHDITGVLAIMNLFLMCIWGAAAVIFWVLAPRFARFMLPRAGSAGGLSFSGQYLQSIALSVVGALLAAWSIPPLVRTIAFGYQTGGIWSDDGNVELATRAAALAVGIALFFGAKGLAHHWHRIRGQGDQVKEETS